MSGAPAGIPGYEGLNEGQYTIATRFDKRLFVSAGAGSGKTFSLTQRVIRALEEGSAPDGGCVLGSIDEALIITFTDKAANEIKERIRAELMRRGHTEQALGVDGAWISTIHGMCSRLLRQHAFAIGLDPDFVVLGENVVREYTALAISTAIHEHSASGALAPLIGMYPVSGHSTSNRDGASTIAGMVERMMQKAASMPGGLDAFDMIGYDAPVALDEKGNEVNPPLLDALSPALRLRALTKRAIELYTGIKRARNALDNDDLLNLCAELLDDARIAQETAARFKLVMVDEFQDTSSQQVRIINRLIADRPEKLITVGDAQQSIYRFRGADVSVFTQMQDGLAAREEAGGSVMLARIDENFRSHADILRFVRTVCAGGADGPAPGEEPLLRRFMDLVPEQEDEDAGKAERARLRHQRAFGGTAFDGDPRVFVEAAAGGRSEERRRAIARGIADRFCTLHEENGIAYSDMALLIGSTSAYGTYMDALRERGIACVVTGGSNFSRMPEVRVVAALLHTLANPHDTDGGLFPLLSSGMFGFTAEDFVLLGSGKDARSGKLSRRDLELFFLDPTAKAPEGFHITERIALARRVLSRAFRRMGSWNLADTLHAAVMESGWLDRLATDPIGGIPRAANVLEAISFVRGLVHDMGLGTARAAYEFDIWLDSVKNGPASLSGNALDAVSIMTVHASKGLQFKVVGVAECLRDPYREHSTLVMAPVKDRIVWGLCPAGYRVEENRKAGVENEYDRLTAIDVQAEKEERGRLIYVALTRAEEALVVGLSLSSTKKHPAGTGTDIADRCARAIVGASGAGVFQSPTQAEFDFGGYAPGMLRVHDPETAPDADGASGEEKDDPDAVDAAIDAACGFRFRPYELPEASIWRASGDSYSYSSASAVLDAERGDPEHRTPELKARPRTEVGEDLTEERQASFESFDDDRATEFGSAMHMACQVMAEGAYPFGASLPKERLDAIAAWCKLPEEGCARDRSAARGLKSRADLSRAIERWASCDVRAEALSWPRLRAEVPFFTKAKSRFGSVVTGFIDLLADDPSTGDALVVDYKSGNLAFTPEGFEADHAMQANFYAWVLMKEGYSSITCKFVALQRDDGEPAGQPLVATYRFDEENPPKLDW